MSKFQLNQKVFISPSMSSVVNYNEDYVMSGTIVKIETNTVHWADKEPEHSYEYMIEIDDSLEYITRQSKDIYLTKEEAITKSVIIKLEKEYDSLIIRQRNIEHLLAKLKEVNDNGN